MITALRPETAGRRTPSLVVDPFRGDDALYRRAFGELQPAVDALVRTARPPA